MIKYEQSRQVFGRVLERGYVITNEHSKILGQFCLTLSEKQRTDLLASDFSSFPQSIINLIDELKKSIEMTNTKTPLACDRAGDINQPAPLDAFLPADSDPFTPCENRSWFIEERSFEDIRRSRSRLKNTQHFG